MRILLLFVALISYADLSIAQENQELLFDYQVLYKMHWQPDTAGQQQTQEETTELLIKDDISLFQTVLLGKIDSINYLRYTGHPSAPTNNEYYTHFNTQVLKDGDDIWTIDIIAPDRQNPGENFLEIQEANGTNFISAENRMIIKKNVEWNFRANSNWIEPYP